MAALMSHSESPFLDVRSFELRPEADAKRLGLSSPFVEAFAFEDSEPEPDPRGAVRRILRATLYDEEFDDAVYQLVGEITAARNGGDPRRDFAGAAMRLAPLADAVEGFIQQAAEHFGSRDVAAITESEIDEVFGRVGAGRPLSPGFEHIFGSIRKAVSKVAKSAVSLAKKGIETAARLGLGPLLDKLKKLVRPLLERVLKTAISRLPAAVQPAATRLAGKLPLLFASELDADGSAEPALSVDAIQSEFNERVVDLLVGDEEPRPDEETAILGEAYSGMGSGIADLDAARDQFIAELDRIEDGEDAGPALERFIPALLPALKLGLRLAGRKRVVDLLAGLVSKLIARFVGPQASRALSAALVDSGLKLLGLEVSDVDQRRTAHAALAATVEDTVRSVAALPDAVLDNEMLFEGSVLRAFEEAAASNLPPLLPGAVYRRRPELAETDSRQGAWVLFPIRGPKRYKKFSRVIRTRITPHLAMSVNTFGEAPLAQYLQEQLGLQAGEDVEAEVHIYESLPGTHLDEVARLEANGAGPAATAEFHPLTPQAAALVAREPGLGRRLPIGSGGSPRNLLVGQRFFRIAIPGRRVAAVAGTLGQTRRRTRLHTVFDFPQQKIRLHLFLSERRAQETAAALRKQEHAGAIAARIGNFIDRSLTAAMIDASSRRVRMIHEALSLDEARGAALERIPQAMAKAFAARIEQWTLTALAEFLAKEAPRFISATEDAKDGVTITVTLANAPGMATLRKALTGTVTMNGDAGLAGAPASVNVDVTSGFTDG